MEVDKEDILLREEGVSMQEMYILSLTQKRLLFVRWKAERPMLNYYNYEWFVISL
jgi:hypothetical protein